MKHLHWQVVTPLMRQVLGIVGRSSLAPRFYLAGGTALALQLGHRRSVDLDFFSETDEVRPETHGEAAHVLSPLKAVTVEEIWGNLVLVVGDSVRVGFFGYGYRLVEPSVPAEGVPLASLVDIGLMKLDALASRGARKDFYDLYAIGLHIGLRALLDRAPEKYPTVRDFEAMVVRHMVCFRRAEQEEMPAILQPGSWDDVKAFFREQAAVLGREWLE